MALHIITVFYGKLIFYYLLCSNWPRVMTWMSFFTFLHFSVLFTMLNMGLHIITSMENWYFIFYCVSVKTQRDIECMLFISSHICFFLVLIYRYRHDKKETRSKRCNSEQILQSTAWIYQWNIYDIFKGTGMSM